MTTGSWNGEMKNGLKNGLKMARAHLVIRGKVQGVFYRVSTANEAARLNINGWVGNCVDGSVEAVFDGKRADVELIIKWCRRGPSGARVDNVTVRWEEPTEAFTNFSIRH